MWEIYQYNDVKWVRLKYSMQDTHLGDNEELQGVDYYGYQCSGCFCEAGKGGYYLWQDTQKTSRVACRFLTVFP